MHQYVVTVPANNRIPASCSAALC